MSHFHNERTHGANELTGLLGELLTMGSFVGFAITFITDPFNSKNAEKMDIPYFRK